MTSTLLEQALEDFITESLKNMEYLLPKKATTTKIKVKRGFFPPETSEEEIIPCVMIRTKKVEETDTERNIHIIIIIGIWHKETIAGYDLIAATNNRILDDVAKASHIGEYFSVNSEKEWEIAEDITYPYWMSEMSLSFKSPKPEPVIPY